MCFFQDTTVEVCKPYTPQQGTQSSQAKLAPSDVTLHLVYFNPALNIYIILVIRFFRFHVLSLFVQSRAVEDYLHKFIITYAHRR